MAPHAQAGSHGELVRGTAAAGHGTREALAAKLQHVGTGKLKGMQGCMFELAEQQSEQSEAAQNMQQTFQAGSGKQPWQHSRDVSSASSSSLTVKRRDSCRVQQQRMAIMKGWHRAATGTSV